MNGRLYIHQLTGIRGVAAWYVVLYHFRELLPNAGHETVFRFLDSGYLAVDLFFLLSGFILSYVYSARLRTITREGLIHFYSARVARIYPLHLFILLLYILNPIAIALHASQFPTDTRYDAGYYAASLVLIQNWGGFDYLAWNVPAWSISVECFAYILFPALTFAISRYVTNSSRAAVFGFLTLISLAVIFKIAGAESIGDLIPQLGLIRGVLLFLSGMLLFVFFENGALKRNLRPEVLFFLGCATMAIGAYTGLENYYYVPLSFCFFLASLVSRPWLLTRVSSSRIVMFVGEISYSTYMVHYFVRDWVKFLLVRPDISPYVAVIIYIGTILISSVLLWKFVETPSRAFLNKSFSKRSEV